MIASKSFPISDQRLFAVVGAVVTLGTVAAVLVAVASLVLAAYLVSVAMSALSEITHTIVALYGSSDSLTQFLIIILVGFVLFKCGRLLFKAVR